MIPAARQLLAGHLHAQAVMQREHPHFESLIVGGGPAALGVLCCILRRVGATRSAPGAAPFLLIDDRPERCGRIGAFRIGSDTQAKKFLTCLDGLPIAVRQDPDVARHAARLRVLDTQAAPLPLVGAFLASLKQRVIAELCVRGWLAVKRSRAHALEHDRILWAVPGLGVRARSLVIACGASERRDTALSVLDTYGLQSSRRDRVATSSEWLARSSDATLPAGVGKAAGSIVILGSSHSAISSAAKALRGPSASRLAPGAVTVLHRSAMTATFASATAARAAGYHGFTAGDICPVTQRVHALGGFRLDSRDLLMALRGWGGSEPEPRVEAVAMASLGAPDLAARLNRADLIITALGYAPDLPRLSVAGDVKAFRGPRHVDRRSRLLDASGRALPNAYGIGLAMGYDLRGRFGEWGFSGQANGLVLWFKDIGESIAADLLAPVAIAARASA